MYDSWLLSVVGHCGGTLAICVEGMGCTYSVISSLHLSACMKSLDR